ncbi:hypothetical protein CHU98_g9983 [Xylaria longipes]|nr:hypothetical protein CHU98_g9983 [Xylaria longipes]
MSVERRLIVSGPEATAGLRFTTDVIPLATKGTQLIIEAVFLVLITSLWTVLSDLRRTTNLTSEVRIWSRRLMRVPLAAEDWFHIVSLIFFYGLAVATVLSAVIGGAGHHVNTLQPWHIVIFSIEFLYAFSVGFAKISITLMIMRIFIVQHVRVAGICIIALSAAWMVHPLFTGLLLCTPVEANWNPATPGAHCGNQYIGFGIVAGLDLINELALLILPIPSLLGIHLNTRYKVALIAVFGTGIITLIVTVIRVPILITTNFHDLTFDTRNQQVVLAEPAAALVVSCSPILRPVFDKAFTRITGRTRQDTATADSTNGFRSARSRSHMKKSRGYTSFGDSREFLELGDVASPYGDRQTEITSTTHPFEEGLGKSPDDSNAAGILVMKETIIVRK